MAWAALLIGFGAGVAYRASRGLLPRDVPLTRGGDGRYRLLVVANETVGGAALLEEIGTRSRGRRQRDPRHHAGAGRLARRALGLRHRRSDGARPPADGALADRDRQRLRPEGRGGVGDSDPNVAIEDALRVFPADEIVISTHPPQTSHWLERGVVERAREEIDLPITHVVVDLATERARRPLTAPVVERSRSTIFTVRLPQTTHSALSSGTMEPVREAWTDERLDDLNHRVDDGFREMRTEFRAVRPRSTGISAETMTASMACSASIGPGSSSAMTAAMVTGFVAHRGADRHAALTVGCKFA